MNRICPHCGASLHEEAVFCPYCTNILNRRVRLKPPVLLLGRGFRTGVVLFLITAVIFGCYYYTLPRIYEGDAQVFYSDHDGNYQILLGISNDRYTPESRITTTAEKEKEYRFPVCLFVNHVDSGANASAMFLQKVESIVATFGDPSEPPDYISYTIPAPHDYCPDAASISFVDFIGRDFTVQGTWTITMKNGDVIRLSQTVDVDLIKTLDYYPEDRPMDTLEELQSLIDEIAGTTNSSAVVNIHLPAVTYEGNLVMEKRPVNLYGSTGSDGRTTFTGTLRVASRHSHISYIQDIDFSGDGSGVGVSASAGVHIVNCNFTGWKTGVLAYGYTWVNLQSSHFEGNEVGFHFNATGGVVSHRQYTGNEFIGNGTGILLENVPTDVTMIFDKCLFSKNDKDIDNQCNQNLNIQGAVFQ